MRKRYLTEDEAYEEWRWRQQYWADIEAEALRRAAPPKAADPPQVVENKGLSPT